MPKAYAASGWRRGVSRHLIKGWLSVSRRLPSATAGYGARSTRADPCRERAVQARHPCRAPVRGTCNMQILPALQTP